MALYGVALLPLWKKDCDEDYYAGDEGRIDGCDHDDGEESDDDGQDVESENLAAK